MKALIVYGTRYGATESTVKEIKEVLEKAGIEVRVVDATQEKVEGIAEYGLIIVGSGIKVGRWVKEAERFLKDHKSELRTKKLALFVSSGTWPMYEEGGPFADAPGESRTSKMLKITREDALEKYVAKKARKYSLEPVSMGLFGGLLDFDSVGGLWGRMMRGLREDLKERGVDTSKPYDNRDLEAIRRWAKELAKLV